MWDVVAQVMRMAAIKVMGPTPRRRAKPWLRGKEAEIHELETAVHRCEEELRKARVRSDPNLGDFL